MGKALLAILFWGASFVATKIVVLQARPLTVVWLRFAMGIVVLGAFVTARRQLAAPPRRELPYLVLLAFLGIALHQWLQVTGLVTATAVASGWIVATTPVFMAILGWIFLGEKLRLSQAGGILLASAGVLVLVGRVPSAGELLILVSAPNWAVFSILSRRGLSRHPPATLMLWVMVIGWLMVTASGAPGIPSFDGRGWVAIAFLGVLCSGVAYVFWYDALAVLPAARVGALLYLEPLVTLAVAAAVLAEWPTVPTVLGGAAIFAGVWLAARK
jgi:drug/metabolite transporter (DMT)-like permease